MRSLQYTLIAFIAFGCSFTGSYRPVENNDYSVEGKQATWKSKLFSVSVSGEFGRPDIYAQSSQFELAFSLVQDTLTLKFDDARLFADSTVRQFRLVEVIGPGGRLDDTISLIPSHEYSITFYYHLSDSSLYNPQDHIRNASFTLEIVQKNGVRILCPKFWFRSNEVAG